VTSTHLTTGTHPTGHRAAHTWVEAEHALRAALRRLAAVEHDLRAGTFALHWRGGAADRFASRTQRRYRELAQQQDSLRYLLSLVQTAATATEPAR